MKAIETMKKMVSGSFRFRYFAGSSVCHSKYHPEKSHPSKWMIWEGNPIKTSSDGLKSLGIASLVFDPCGNEPEKGDYLTVMRKNMENLKGAFL